MKAIKKLAALVLTGALCMSVFAGCGIDAEKTAATYGEETVTLGFVNFMAKYQKAAMDDTYQLYASYFGVDDLWDTDLYGSGSTMKESLLTSIMSYLHDMYTLKAHMSDYNVTLSTEDEQKIKDAATAFMTSNTEDALEEMGATQEYAESLLTLYTIEWYMYNAIIADTDYNVSDEEANMRGFSYVEIAIDGSYDSSYNWTDYTEEEVAAFKETASKMVKEIAESTLEDVAEAYDYDVTTDAYATYEDDDSMDETLLAALKALKEGEVSDVIETEDALYIVRIDADTDEEATEENREAIIADRETALYEEVMKGWQENDGWTVDESAVATIDFHHVFTQETETESETGSEKETGSEATSETESETTTETAE